MSRFINARYAQMEAYTPGEQPTDMQYIKLNTNESPFPPSPGVLKAVEAEAGRLQLYSDPESRLVTEALARRYGVGIAGSEITGIVPMQALLDCAEYYLQLEDFSIAQVLEYHL